MDRSDVFLSYRRKDVEFTKLVDQALKKSGREVWVDWEDIPPGVEGFADEIQKGIEGADAFIAVLSPSYLESEYCLMELKEALRLKKRIVPIVYLKFEPAPPPEGIGHINWVYFTPHAGQENTFEQSFPKVLQALEADYEHAREHTRLLLRALDWDKHSRNVSYLLKGAEIEKAESWHVAGAGKDPSPTEMQGEFILLSRKQQRRQQQMFTGVIGVLLVLAAIAAVFAIFQATEAKRQENIAVTAQAEAVAAKDEAIIARDSAVVSEATAVAAKAEAVAANVVIARNADVSHSNALAAAAELPTNEKLSVALALEAARSPNAPQEVLEVLDEQVYRPGGLRYEVRLPEADMENAYLTMLPGIAPDGTTLVYGGILFDATTGSEIRHFEQVSGYPLAALYTRDSQQVFLSGDDEGYNDPTMHPVYLGRWDVATGKLLQKYDTGIGIGQIQLSPDEKTLIGYQPDGKAVWWNVETGAKIREVDTGENAMFSPDLKWLVKFTLDSSTSNLAIDLMDVETMSASHLVDITFYGNNNFYGMASAFSPDSSEFALIFDGLQTFSIPDGRRVRRYNNPQGSSVESIRYSPDGTMILTGGLDGSVIAWQRDSGKSLTLQPVDHDQILIADFIDDGARTLSMDIQGRVAVRDAIPGNLVRVRSESPIAAFMPDGQAVVTQAYNVDTGVYEIAVRDVATLQELSRIPVSGTVVGYALTGGLDKARVAYFDASQDEIPVITFHDASLKTGKIESSWVFEGAYSFDSVFLLPDGERVLAVYYDADYVQHIELRDAAGGEVLHTYPDLPPAYKIAISPDGSRMLLYAGEVSMVDIATGDILFTKPSTYAMPVFMPDGKQYLADVKTENGHDIALFDAQTGEMNRVVISQMPFEVDHLAVTPDGQSLMTWWGYFIDPGGGARFLPSGILALNQVTVEQPEGTLMQWDIATGTRLHQYPTTWFENLTISPDSKYAWSSATERWRLDTPQEMIAWACANRYVPEFTPEQRAQFNITSETSVCAAQ